VRPLFARESARSGKQGDKSVTELRRFRGAEHEVRPGGGNAGPNWVTTVWRRVSATGRIREVGTFATIGVASTILHLGLFALLRTLFGASQVANAVALLTATVFNTAANRRLTFGVTGRSGAVRQQVQGLIVFALTLGLTSASLAVLHSVASHPAPWEETLTVAVATLAATVLKYLAMRQWMFGSSSAWDGA
jgi:putative flippase GtrA